MRQGPNRLIHEKSLYLQQHAKNPVDWFPWGEEALEKARLEDKPILVSVGYSACHWCHVMEAESFEDPEVAVIQNQHFVSIKVDREERPDVDRVYMEACQLLTGGGGWPLNVFLLPDGRPFFAGTYFPKDARYGRMGWKDLLSRIHRLYQEQREDVLADAMQITEMIGRQETSDEEIEGLGIFDSFSRTLSSRFDREHGGLGRGTKFPNVPIFEILWWRGHLLGDVESLEILQQAMDAMAVGGLYDHLGGGFHRYCVDREWSVPHFEKMLYDNGLLLRLYAEQARLAPSEKSQALLRETATYLKREMTGPEGLFYAAQDADSEGEEGRFFVWEPREVRKILDEDAPLLCAALGISEEGNFEGGKSVLSARRSEDSLCEAFGLDKATLQSRIAQGRQRLWEVREQRIKPARDEKRITAWNALTIQGLARAGLALQEDALLEQASRAALVYLEHFEQTGTLHRLAYLESSDDAEDRLGWKTLGFLEDYAFLALAWMDLFVATGDIRWMSAAERLCQTMIERFGEEEASGLRLGYVDRSAASLVVQPQSAVDEAIPSSLGAALLACTRLFLWTGETHYRDIVEGHLRAHAKSIKRSPAAFSSLLRVHLHATKGIHTVVAVLPQEVSAQDLQDTQRALARLLTPDDLLLVYREGAPPLEAPRHLWEDRTTQKQKTTYYVCDTDHCHVPVHELSEVAKSFPKLSSQMFLTGLGDKPDRG
ncbi:MAG: thioredoxin domain-containing protein [Myxococcales bacterium]|nr:thioredoxin domain-containing protein [Myxococcales bacterium]